MWTPVDGHPCEPGDSSRVCGCDWRLQGFRAADCKWVTHSAWILAIGLLQCSVKQIQLGDNRWGGRNNKSEARIRDKKSNEEEDSKHPCADREWHRGRGRIQPRDAEGCSRRTNSPKSRESVEDRKALQGFTHMQAVGKKCSSMLNFDNWQDPFFTSKFWVRLQLTFSQLFDGLCLLIGQNIFF